MVAALVIASSLRQEGSVRIVPKLAVDAKQTVSFEVKAQVGAAAADINAKAVLKVVKTDAAGAEYSIDWQDLHFSSNKDEADLAFSPFKVDVSADGNLTDVEGGVAVADPARTVMITYFPRPPSALDLNKALVFSLPAHEKGGVPAVKVTETYQGVDTVGTLSAYKVLVKEEEAPSAQGENFELDATFWVNAGGDVLKEDGKFMNLPIPEAGTNAAGTITAKVIGQASG